jgi:hypothetical protein
VSKYDLEADEPIKTIILTFLDLENEVLRNVKSKKTQDKYLKKLEEAYFTILNAVCKKLDSDEHDKKAEFNAWADRQGFRQVEAPESGDGRYPDAILEFTKKVKNGDVVLFDREGESSE